MISLLGCYRKHFIDFFFHIFGLFLASITVRKFWFSKDPDDDDGGGGDGDVLMPGGSRMV